MANENRSGGGTPPWIGMVVLAAVAAVVVVAGALFVIGGDDGDPQASSNDPDATATVGLSDAPGAPTPLPNTGAIDTDPPEVGELAPDFALASVRDPGEVLKLSDYRGTAVILNWYASWCGPCKEEIPAFEAAYQEVGADQLTVFGVNYIESQEKAEGILDEFGATYPATMDTNAAISDQWRVVNMPTTYFIDADGVIVSRIFGPLSLDELADQLAELGIDWTPASS